MNQNIVFTMPHDDVTVNQLCYLARSHVKLVLEYGEANTSPERRRAIKGEIEALRAERDLLLVSSHSPWESVP